MGLSTDRRHKIRPRVEKYLRGGEQGSEAFRQNGRGCLDKDTGHTGLEWFGNDVAVVVGKHSFKWIHVLMRLSFKVKNVGCILSRVVHSIMNNSNHSLKCNFK